jgi:hypothetical protein
MKPKTLILMLLAVCFGVVGSYLTSLVTAQLAVQAEVEKVGVLVARRNITVGTLLSEPDKWFEEKQFVKGEEPKSGLHSFDELKDRRLNKPLSTEQVVTARDLSERQIKEPVGDQEPGKRKEVAIPKPARATLPKLMDDVQDRRRGPDHREPENKQKVFYENLVKSLEKLVSDVKQTTRNCKDRAERHRLMLGRYEGEEQTLTRYNALLQGQREQQQMDESVKRMEARDKRLDKLTAQLRQAVSVGDWELAARVHSRILKECAEATR